MWNGSFYMVNVHSCKFLQVVLIVPLRLNFVLLNGDVWMILPILKFLTKMVHNLFYTSFTFIVCDDYPYTSPCR